MAPTLRLAIPKYLNIISKSADMMHGQLTRNTSPKILPAKDGSKE